MDLNSGVLHYDFGLCSETRDITKKYKIHICGYQIVDHIIHPFLQYLFQQEFDVFHFPTFYFRCMQNLQVDPDEEMTPEHVYFKNECLKYALEIMNVHVQEKESLEEMYKGFIYNDKGGEYDIFVFFDFTGLSVNNESEIKRTWGLINEIINREKIFEYPIHPPICQIFQKNESLVYLCDEDDKQIPYPESLYLCKQSGPHSYANLYNTEVDDKNESVYFIDERMNHPILGYFYFFSIAPLNYSASNPVHIIRRFAVFLIDPLYILKPLSQLEAIPPKKTLGDVIPSVVDYFSASDSTYKISDVSRKKKTITNQLNRCTYFQEIINDVRTPFWCIKSSTHFTEI